VQEVLAGAQQDFPVLDESGRVIGVLTRNDLFVALSQNGLEAPVSSVMRTSFSTADIGEMLQPGFARLQESEVRTMPVLRQGQLVGLLTPENLQEFLMIQSALRGKSGRGNIAQGERVAGDVGRVTGGP
jgi:predicted transcriptional regulator